MTYIETCHHKWWSDDQWKTSAQTIGNVASWFWLTIPCLIVLFWGCVRQSDQLPDVQCEQTRSEDRTFWRGDVLMRLVDRRRLQKIQFRCRSRSVALANHDNFPVISGFNLRSYFWFVQGIAALGKFFFAISGLSDCHRTDLAAIWQVYFRLGRRSLSV